MSLKKTILFDPSYGTSNIGDQIINRAIMKEMDFLFKSNFLIRYSTHSPLMDFHQLFKSNYISRNCADANYKLLGGSNIFKNNLLKYTLDWNINIFTKKLYRNSIALGSGLEGDQSTINYYTRYIYKSILSKDYVHSVRDAKTEKFLNSLGFKTINTGCPTLWTLNQDQCNEIPHYKARNVVFTLTDYNRDVRLDNLLVKKLIDNYDQVYFWPQGSDDYDYFLTLKKISSINIIDPNLDAFKGFLLKGSVDYIGTRLHAGIFALQNKIRSIIIEVDNRALDMAESFNLNTIKRSQIKDLDQIIHKKIITDIKIDESKINEWKSQFKA
jgi:polysaccharide pyruvyl transferase WcaK-like protein